MRSTTSPGVQLDAWNLFQHKTDGDLWCAVPCNHRLPGFLFSGAWAHANHKVPSRMSIIGFHPTVACHGVGLNGFYLFHRLHS